MTEILAGRRIALGVSGSIAAYKALTLASRLTEAGAEVDAILTRAAAELVRPLAFQALTHRPVAADLWDPTSALGMDHLVVAQAADVLLIAPATADLVARLALGLADDALTTTALASRAPLVIAPAMEPDMWRHPATQWHAATLIQRGAHLVGPVEGRLASGRSGAGRLAEPEQILDAVRRVLAAGGPLSGRHVLITAGPTREAIDPVRYLSNHSSGRMGLAIARAALYRGARVSLVLGPVTETVPDGIAVTVVETADEMRQAVLTEAPDVDAVVMAAAVADYRPAEVHRSKLKKGAAGWSLDLVRNPDILAELAQSVAGAARRPMLIGFAAETDELLVHARGKLSAKGLDLVVANPVPATFGSDRVDAILVEPDAVTPLGPGSKEAVAEAIVDRIQAWLAASVAADRAAG